MRFEITPKQMARTFRKHWLIFSKGENLRKRCVDERVPNEPGVYLIWSEKKSRKPQLLYVGKAGGCRADGARIKQGLFRRINNKHFKLSRDKWLPTRMSRQGLEKVRIEWHVTRDIIPAAVEGNLLQWYVRTAGRCPEWNREA